MSKIWFGLHLPNYTFPDRPPEQLFDAIVEQAKAAEAAGFGMVTVMDHLNQIPGIGQQDEPMLEAWTRWQRCRARRKRFASAPS